MGHALQRRAVLSSTVMVLVLPALGLAVAAGLVGWWQLHSSATPSAASTAPESSVLPSMAVASEATPNQVASASPVATAVASANVALVERLTQPDAGAPIVLVKSNLAPTQPVLAGPQRNAAASKTPNAGSHAAAKPAELKPVTPPKPSQTGRSNNNAAGF